MLEAALSTSPVVTRLLVGTPVRPQKHVSRAPPCCRNMAARALCITIPDDRGDESFADDLNMGRGIVSGRVALLLRSTEIRPHRPKDLLPPSPPENPGSLTLYLPIQKSTKSERSQRDKLTPPGLSFGTGNNNRDSANNRDLKKNRDSEENRDSLRESGLGAGQRDAERDTGSRESQRDSGTHSGSRESQRDSGLAAGHRESGVAAGVGSRSGSRDSQRDREPAVGSRSGTPGLAAGQGTGSRRSQRDSGTRSGTGNREAAVAAGIRDSQRESGVATRRGSRRDPGFRYRKSWPGIGTWHRRVSGQMYLKSRVSGQMYLKSRVSGQSIGTRSGSRDGSRESRRDGGSRRDPAFRYRKSWPGVGTRYRRVSGQMYLKSRVSGQSISGSRESGYRDSGYRDRVSGLWDSQSRFQNSLALDSRDREFFLIFFFFFFFFLN